MTALSAALHTALAKLAPQAQQTRWPQSITSEKVRIGIAYSGGVDSSALLHCAAHAGLNAQLFAAHIDHGISAQSQDWALHCQRFCEQLNVRFASFQARGLSANMPNLENAAREQRWCLLVAWAKAENLDALWLAQHLDDQNETVLLHLMRGTGLRGLGMPPLRFEDGLAVQRPWLSISKSELLAYATAHGISHINDPSNLDTMLRRNAVRHQLLPQLLAVDERALHNLGKFAQLAQDNAALQDEFAQAHLAQHANDAGLDWRSASEGFSLGAQAVLLRNWLANNGVKMPTQPHLQAMLSQIAAPAPDGLRCEIDQVELWLVARRLMLKPKH